MCSMERPIYRDRCANTREGDLMANIAEMVKELQQERDRFDQAIAALASLAGTSKASSARSGASGPRRTLSALREEKFRSRKERGGRNYARRIPRRGNLAR